MAIPTLILEGALGAAAGSAYRDVIIQTGAVEYWRLHNATSIATNEIGGGFNLDPDGTVTEVAGLLPNSSNECVDFNGTDTIFYALLTTGWPHDGGPEMAIELLFQTDTVVSTKTIFRTEAVRLFIDSADSKLKFTVGSTTIASTSALSNGTTYHVIVQYRDVGANLEIQMYINGSQQGSGSNAAGSPPAQSGTLVGGLTLGCTFTAPFFIPSQFFNGRIDEVSIIRRWLETDERELHYISTAAEEETTYTDLSVRLLGFNTKRGRQSEKDSPDAGLMNVTLRNHDRALDPTNASSPYFPLYARKKFRLRATWASVTYDVFTGESEDIDSDVWSAREARIPVVDPLSSLQDYPIGPLDRPVEKAGARIKYLLSRIGVEYDAAIIDTGAFDLLAWTDKEGNAWDLLKAAADADNGLIFANTAGHPVFHQFDHSNRGTNKAVKATFADAKSLQTNPTAFPYVDGKVRARPRAEVINYQTVKQEGDSAGTNTKTAYDAQSMLAFRKRPAEQTVSLNSASDIQTLATYLVSKYAWPQPVIDYVTLIPTMDDNLWPHVLTRDVGDRILILAHPGGLGSASALQCIIQGVEHNFTRFGEWTTTWRLSSTNFIAGSETGTGSDSAVKTP